MKAILIKAFGGPEQLAIGTVPDLKILPEEILVNIKSTALNRADTLQRKGKYPPPPGASDILGLEMAGVIVEVGSKVTKWKVGDRVCSLLTGGGYAEFTNVHESMAIAIPDGWSFNEAAAIPEVFLTAFQAISYLAKLEAGERILIHAGASGVGTAGIQLAKQLNADQIIVTASAGKHSICKALGADICIDYKTQNFEAVVKEATEGKGVDVIIDFLAAPYFQQNINSLALDGRMVMLALMGGINIQNLNVANILVKRLKIMGSTLRSRTLDYKIQLTKDFVDFAFPKFKEGKIKPVIDSVYPWQEASAAHKYMESNQNKGKIILEIK